MCCPAGHGSEVTHLRDESGLKTSLNVKENRQLVKLDCCVHTGCSFFYFFYWTVIRNQKQTLGGEADSQPRAPCYAVCSPISRCVSPMNGPFCGQLQLLALTGQADLTLLISGVWKRRDEVIRVYCCCVCVREGWASGSDL